MIEDFFDTEFSILELSQVRDTVGGDVDTWTKIVGSEFMGYKRLANEREIQKSDRKANEKIFKFKCPTNIAITDKKRLRVGSTDYEIDFVRNVHGNHLKAELTEVEN